MEVENDTPPELQPIFSYLNSHSNKLYQEGYFLKLHDLDSRGRPSPDRVWVECFAQLVGTVLSLWDAAALDAAGEDGEVVPTFVNLSDASLKMIESLPMNGAQGGSLQNVLSISTAANNRYLLHFNSLNSLTQWTAGIRLAMFEHATLQEAYTGSLIAGKGKALNSIKTIMERSKFAHEDWARVRFGAGTPWKRCWCVVSPPDEKEYAKAQKTLKKTSAYERVKIPKGDIKFYDTRKITKKTKPIATVTDAYAAYAIYPQSKPLIDQSTLVKLEGLVTVHGSPETTTESFIFVMPEVHAAVSGFEMMLQFLFPVFDTFTLYGRPSKLVADVLDQRGLMFAMPRDRRYGHLDILDVSALIHTEGSQAWSERQWRRELKKLTAARMSSQMEESPRASRHLSQRRNTTTSRTFSPANDRVGAVRFGDDASIHSSPGSRSASPIPLGGGDNLHFAGPRRTGTAPPEAHSSLHKRSVSDAQGYRKFMAETPSRLSYEATSRPDMDNNDEPPPPPRHGGALASRPYGPGSLERIQSGAVPTLSMTQLDVQTHDAASTNLIPPAPVVSPPAFTHNPNSRPANTPYQAPELRRAHSNVDIETLQQMQDAARQRDDLVEEDGGWGAEMQQRQHNSVSVNSYVNRTLGPPADTSQGLLNSTSNTSSRDLRQRLSTIEGSPNVGSDIQYFQSPEQVYAASPFSRAAESRPEQTLEQLQSDQQTPPVPLHASRSTRSITRKPVPKTLHGPDIPVRDDYLPSERAMSNEQHPMSPGSPVNDESWEGALIDTDALERILNDAPEQRKNTMQSQDSYASSNTPDYASTAPSEDEPKMPVERTRAGKLKTVGDPDYVGADAARVGGAGKFDTWGKDQAEDAAEVPSIDFGPTYAYKPKSRPGTSGTITALDDVKPRSKSIDRLRERSSRDRLSRVSSDETNRLSYFSNATVPVDTGAQPYDPPSNRNSVAWQPAASPITTPGSRQSLTPEQWVQHRAALAAQSQQAPPRKAVPLYAHQRTASGNSVHQLRKSMAKTPPPLSRTPSGDWTQYAQQSGTPPSRPQSRGANTYFGQATPPSRPQSRGASAYLNQPSPGGTLYNTQPTNLTAREQMHVARATGTPLINQVTNSEKKQQEQHQPGLFGALAAREQEKEYIKKAGGRHSMGSQMVQQAIAMRQQQQMEAEVQAQAQLQAQAHDEYQRQIQQQAQAQAQYQYQMQQQAQAQQMQYHQMMLAQNQAPSTYGAQQLQRPGVQSRQSSWQQQPQHQYGYNAGSSGQQYGPAGGYSGSQTPGGGQWQQRWQQ